ncbi:MAG: membrane protein insertion efficiency factor YidD [Candidatus Gracilibacteria bacterium]|nr:membrane protein insertion efficiency factor YidD [Candidatus Gracilibacteria bacterium]
MGKTLFTFFIRLYQLFIAEPLVWFSKLLFGTRCKYTPSCSEYGKLAIEKHGVWKGGVMTAWRLMRCAPWGKGGVDIP